MYEANVILLIRALMCIQTSGSDFVEGNGSPWQLSARDGGSRWKWERVFASAELPP